MRALKVDEIDNVAIAAQETNAGDLLDAGCCIVTATEHIPVGHKVALVDIPAGDMVVKYGVPIGKASRNIASGSHVHTDNVEDITTQLCQAYAAEFKRKAGAGK